MNKLLLGLWREPLYPGNVYDNVLIVIQIQISSIRSEQ